MPTRRASAFAGARTTGAERGEQATTATAAAQANRQITRNLLVIGWPRILFIGVVLSVASLKLNVKRRSRK